MHGQDGRYKGTINLEPFRHKFPNAGCNEIEVVSAPYSGSAKQDKCGIVEILEAKSYREGALLKDGKVAASVCLIQDAGGMNKRAMWEKQHACWELIHDETAKAFFGQRRRVFLSSDAGDLQGFQQRFGQMLDIYVYNGNNIDMYLNEQVDMLIYGEDMWPGRDKVSKYSARQLYADLLVEDMRRYFQAHDIAYYCCILSRPAEDQVHRVVERSVGESIPPFVWAGLAEDYMAPAEFTGAGKANVVNGHRQDAPVVDGYIRSIYMYGPCTVLGTGANFGETIEAKLQESCVKAGRKWRVINCGGLNTTGCDLNSLHCMMHTPMRRGDIVIHYVGSLWQHASAFPFEPLYCTSDAFDDEAHRNGKYFWDSRNPAHVTKDGFAVWAEFWAKKLLGNQQLLAEPSSRQVVQPFFSCLGELQVKNPELKSYLKELARYRYAENGAIVMNANPFTLGHAHLIETARRQVNFLYVFVVEENESAVPFKDRFAMVEANCAGLDNVRVLPSGRYMISALTFPEYFEKEARQNQSILPSRDIRLFADAIAPTLGIVKRFVGEEPFDKVTRQYNEAMKRILPDYGVELIEIPRQKASDGKEINATQVRAWIKNNDWEKCRGYLSDITLNYLREHGIKL